MTVISSLAVTLYCLPPVLMTANIFLFPCSAPALRGQTTRPASCAGYARLRLAHKADRARPRPRTFQAGGRLVRVGGVCQCPSSWSLLESTADPSACDESAQP